MKQSKVSTISFIKNLAVFSALAVSVVTLGSSAIVQAHGSNNGDRSETSRSDEDDKKERRVNGRGLGAGRASSYINPDVGAATANPDVNANSNCYTPDQNDTQKLSDAGSTARNVHNDACFVNRDGTKVNGPASFVSTGVGVISACPDPDGAGPETATLSADKKRCFQSAYQERFNADGNEVAGNEEFHARLNNTTDPGLQFVTWCSDKDNDGCDDEHNKSSVVVNWVR